MGLGRAGGWGHKRKKARDYLKRGGRAGMGSKRQRKLIYKNPFPKTKCGDPLYDQAAKEASTTGDVKKDGGEEGRTGAGTVPGARKDEDGGEEGRRVVVEGKKNPQWWCSTGKGEGASEENTM